MRESERRGEKKRKERERDLGLRSRKEEQAFRLIKLQPSCFRRRGRRDKKESTRRVKDLQISEWNSIKVKDFSMIFIYFIDLCFYFAN